jgi:hypothetical protein
MSLSTPPLQLRLTAEICCRETLSAALPRECSHGSKFFRQHKLRHLDLFWPFHADSHAKFLDLPRQVGGHVFEFNLVRYFDQVHTIFPAQFLLSQVILSLLSKGSPHRVSMGELRLLVMLYPLVLERERELPAVAIQFHLIPARIDQPLGSFLWKWFPEHLFADVPRDPFAISLRALRAPAPLL